ncbi:uncharacterized protein LOC123537495 [Mercenaria mercenaria]|uniref:uncharacterized protein LOC123537495 n=1 Tax=Mercenaria mercenaria TaxID=6596 RepID=UPI00234E7600|nr:uncharacterized protein LOC123537495 [Mercenaria mercenaria]XP_053389404.1 uncharacterized protein LOC123537495 [Mercenaria mercenaria]
MGNSESARLKDEEQKLQRYIKNTIKCIETHRHGVFGIAHTVETQHALFELLSSKISGIASVNETDTKVDSDGEPIDVTCCHCTSAWQESTKRLLGSVQSSLRCQSKALQSSFINLNGCVHKILDYYRVDVGTSVDKDIDKFWIDYENSPKVDYQTACTDLENENKSLKKIIQKISVELNEVTARNEKHLEEREKSLRKTQNENEILREQKVLVEEKVAELKANVQSMKSVIETLNADKVALERQANTMKQTIPVQLYHSLKGGTLPNLLDELKKLLVTQMEVERHKIQFVLCQTEKDVNPAIPVLVFCINASRLGTDAATALHNLKVSSKVSVLIFHHKDIHALPNQSSKRVLTGPEFKALGGIFDIAFLSEKGIYPCDMNQTAAVGIESFLRTQS